MRSGLFLDFDGVLCDSVSECYASSWIAFFERYRGETPRAVDIRSYRLFRSYRPYIRSGEDYLLLHSLILDGVEIRNQAEFDAAVERAGAEHMATYRALLYTVREELVQQSVAKWRALHAAYPGIPKRLASLVRDPSVWIVSTKRQEFIRRVLEGWGIWWPAERISMPVSKSKVEIIQSVMASRRMGEALFVDDHADDLGCSDVEGLTCRLANWGHVTAEALHDPAYTEISLDELLSVMDKRLAGS